MNLYTVTYDSAACASLPDSVINATGQGIGLLVREGRTGQTLPEILQNGNGAGASRCAPRQVTGPHRVEGAGHDSQVTFEAGR